MAVRLRSSVLGGVVIAEIDESGQREGHVYVGGEKIADYNGWAPYGVMDFRHANPANGNWVNVHLPGNGSSRREFDPLGANVGTIDPFVSNTSYNDMVDNDWLYQELGNPFDMGSGCPTLDGMPISCSELQNRMETGSVEAEFPDHMVNGRNGRAPARRPIRSLGIGLFGVWLPDGSRGNDLQWDFRIFSFSNERSVRSHHALSQGQQRTPCDVQVPTDQNNRSVLATLMGEASTPGENTWGSDQSGVDAFNHPSGTLTEENVYDEMLQMVAVVDHRLRDWGEREHYSNWKDVVERPGQFLGYQHGQNILQNLGSQEDPNCIRAHLGVVAIKAFHDSSWTSPFYYWKGIKQKNSKNQWFIRARQGAWRWANTDFQISQ